MSSQVVFLFFIVFLSLLLLIINLVIATHNPYGEKKSPFECGFSSFLHQNRTQFNVSFFIFALLFLLFDLEILLIYPYSVTSSNNIAYGLIIMLIFFILLTLGFIFELGKNALTIYSKQYEKHTRSVGNNDTNIIQSFVFSNYILTIRRFFKNLKKRIYNKNFLINILSSTFSALLIRSFFMLIGVDILQILKNPLLSTLGFFLINFLRLFINNSILEIIDIRSKNIFNMMPWSSGGGASNGPGANGSTATNNPGGNQNPLPVTTYDPLGDIPPTDNRELYVLIRYRLQRLTELGGFNHGSTFRVTQVFGTDNLVNNMAKQLLLRHILNNRYQLGTAYRQLVDSTRTNSDDEPRIN